MMGTIRIQNRGKNLMPTKYDFSQAVQSMSISEKRNLAPIIAVDEFKGQNTILVNNKIVIDNGSATSYYYGLCFLLFLKPNTTYTFSCNYNSDRDAFFSSVYNVTLISNNYLYSNGGRISFTFSTGDDSYAEFRIEVRYKPSYWEMWDLQIEEGSSTTDYESTREDYIEFDSELFGYAGVFDELRDDGTLIKRWQRVTGISITNGSGSLSGNPLGIGTCILINETDGLPYEGTVSGTSISTSAPDGTYTVIYQLATPEIIDLNYDGELILYPGENNLILPDFAVASISGARKYLEG